MFHTETVSSRQRPYSIRTRIKTPAGQPELRHLQDVRDHIPLEQGLRPCSHKSCINRIYVRDHIPLEQGLRLCFEVSTQSAGESETIFH